MNQPVVVHQAGQVGADPMVLLHGVTDAGTAWPDAMAHWSGHEPPWHVHSISLRGHGESPRFEPHEYATMMDVWVDDLVDVLEAISRPCVVVGHSLGGRIAVLAAHRRPALVKALVLEDPALPDTTPERLAEMRSWRDGLVDYQQRCEQEVRQAVAQGWTQTEASAWAAAHTQVDLDMMAHLDMGPMDSVQALRALTVPTLVVAPRGSLLLPDPDEVANPLVGFRLVDGVGHCVRRDAPREFFSIVDRFLSYCR